MDIEWNELATIFAPAVTLLLGFWLNRRTESRPNLITYFGHISVFKGSAPNGDTFHVNTHTVVMRNSGRRNATNVRLNHKELPDFNIYPSISYRTEILPDGTQDIVIPTLVPEEEITISYLYFPPSTYSNINNGIKCDQGFAKQIPVLLQRKYPRWVTIGTVLLLMVGTAALVCFLYAKVSGFEKLLGS